MPSSITPAWLRGDPSALALLPAGHRDPAARAAAVAAAAARPVHPAVVESLVTTTAAQREAREALARPGTVAVVSGQQAGLFGGPLYTVYKAAAAVADARALERETGVRCVPVFWLQNEDHDYDEIASTHVLGADGALHAVTAPARPGDEDRAIADRRLGPGVAPALDAVADLLSGLSEADEAVALLRRCYRAERSPCAAFHELIDALFARHGLLVVAPRHPLLVEAARPLHRRAVAEADAVAEALGARAEALQAAGFTVQVHVRPRSPLSFVHPDGPGGPRYRVEPAEGGWRLCGTERRVSDAVVAGGPHSTSALLRPILQDTLLPTAAYVGGPGEIAYFAQLPPLYAHFGLPMPLVVPRARFRVVDEAADRLLAQLGLAADDPGAPRSALLARVAQAGDRPDPDAVQAALLGPIRQVLAELAPHAEELDRGLAKAVDKAGDQLTGAASRLVDRYRRALAASDAVTVDRLDRLLARLQPDGAPQERVHGLAWYAARYGPERFVDAVLAAVRPFHGDLEELRP